MIVKMLISAAIITGIYTTLQPGNIFHKIIPNGWPDWITSPLFACPHCMSSIHGIWTYLIIGGDLVYLPIHLLGVCGIMRIIEKIADL